VIALIASVLFFTTGARAFADEPELRFDGQRTFEVTSLSKNQLKAIEACLTDKYAPAPFAVYLVDASGKASKTALSGSASIASDVLRFRPQFPLEPGKTYLASFQPVDTAGTPSRAQALTKAFSIPGKAQGPATTITAVYPTQDLLPENQLKFYLHFSAPMSRGDIYRHLHLLNENGKVVDLPFLELDEELWDARQQRLTLLFDPGRIKRGLKPREDVGPVLEEGKSYTFVVDADWPDANGNPLAKGYRKSLRAGPPDDHIVDLAQWKITAPRARSSDSLSIQFPKALDQAMAEHLIWVETEKGARLMGSTRLVDHEHRWTFSGAQPWSVGDYRIAVDSTVEDLAGNSVGKPFEIDVLRPVQKKVEQKIHYLPFAVR
jgi:hypothetical protein